ncbi:MAG: hypothetical protein L0Z55_06550 [Planctomycetes bacterium]|nr:hypothetical protein [Planctomycetota bacterium]
MATAISPEPVHALEMLRGLRAKHARLRNAAAVSRLILLAVVFVWVSFFLDWMLDLPQFVRLLQLAAGAVLCFRALRIFIAAFRRSLSDDYLAARVERATPGLEEALLTAVQLSAPGHPRAALYAPQLLARTVALAEARVAEVDAGRLIQRRTTMLSLLALAIAGGALLQAASMRPDLARVYVRRNVLLSSEQWPREYLFELVEPDPSKRDIVLAIGDPLSIVATRKRGGETRVDLRAEFADGERETFPLEKKGPDTYRKLFRNVTQGMRFRVMGGDYESQEYRVTVRQRPRIEEVLLAFDYPDYTALPDVVEPRADLGGHVKVPVGTIVKYTARTSVPVQRAQFRLEWREGGEDRREDAALAAEDGTLLAGSFKADRNGFYSFRLESMDGFENSNPVRYRIALIADQPPAVQFVVPGKNTEVGIRARLPLQFDAADDYGLKTTFIVFRTVDTEGDALKEVRMPLAELPAGTKEIRIEHLLDISTWNAQWTELEVREGARLDYLAEAVDHIGQVGTSRTYVLTIVKESDLLRLNEGDLAGTREQLEEVLSQVRQNRRELDKLVDGARATGGKVEAERVPDIRFTRLKQDKANSQIDESLERVQEVLDRIATNRLESSVQDLPWITALRDALARLAKEDAPAVLAAFDELNRLAADGAAAVRDIEQVIGREQQVERTVSELVQELAKWGDLRTVIRKMEELIRLEEDLEQKVNERFKSDAEGPAENR